MQKPITIRQKLLKMGKCCLVGNLSLPWNLRGKCMPNKQASQQATILETRVAALNKTDKKFYDEFLALHENMKDQKDSLAIKESFFEQLNRLEELKKDIRDLGLLGVIAGANKILKNLELASPSEKMLTLSVLEHFSNYVGLADNNKKIEKRKREVAKLVAEFLKGGQIIFPDESAKLYGKWSNFTNNLISRKGTSSHQSEDEQFAIRGPFVKEALFGTRIGADGKKYSWLQLESHPTGLRYLLGHLISYVIYRITGKNIGPYGRSVYTEKAPLSLKDQKLQTADKFIGILNTEQLAHLQKLPSKSLEKLAALSPEDKKLYAEFTTLQKDKDFPKITEDFFVMQTQLDALKSDITKLGLVGTDEILKNLEKASLSERMLTLDVLEHLTEYVHSAPNEKTKEARKADVAERMAEFLKGGQIIFPDEGAELYGKWSKFPKNLISRKGTSSHKSEDEQFAVRGPFVKEALFGTRKGADGKKHNWLQLESHPTGLRHLLGHLVSYVIYKITGKNIGPYGRSKYTEANPIKLSIVS